MKQHKTWFRFLLIGFLCLIAFSSPDELTAQAQGETPFRQYLPVIFNPEKPAWMGPYGGSIIALAAAPGQPSIVYAGTASAGVFRSDDGGITWRAANRGLENANIYALAVHPTNSQVVYAGTSISGVYRSEDGGSTWQAVNNGIAANTLVYALAVNPGNPNLIYAGTRIKGTYYHGIMYKSDNGGQSWQNVLDYSDDWVYSIAVSLNTPNVVIAAVHTRGPLVSHNYGNAGSWNAPLPPTSLDSFLQDRWKKGRAIAFDPQPGSSRVYYGAWHDGFLSYSTNNGDPVSGVSSWKMAGGAGQAHVYPNGISVNPTVANRAYFAGFIDGTAPGGGDLPGGVWRSDNGGSYWNTTGLMGKYMYSVASLGGDLVLAGTLSEGLYRSTNGGSTWELSVNGLTNSLVTSMAFLDDQTIFASTKTGGGVWKSVDGGATWTVFNNGLGDYLINGLVQHPVDPNILFALTTKAGLRRIDLRSGGWTQAAAVPLEVGDSLLLSPDGIAAQLPADGANDFEGPESEPLQMVLMDAISKPILKLRFAPSDTSIAYLGTESGGLYKSTDGGSTWQSISLAGITVRDIVVDPLNPDILYAATGTSTGSTVQRSIDGGYHWTNLPLPSASLSIYSLAIWPGDPGAIYAGTNNGVYRLIGNVWTQTGLNGYSVVSLGSHPNNPMLLFAATNAGVYYRSHPSSGWLSPSPELMGVDSQSLNFNPLNQRYLFVGTTYRGTLRMPIRP